ncbi:hypothetical protein ACHQM5_022720 [Ranunculus cassubicifolius]
MKPCSTKKRRTDTSISIRQWDSITPEILSLILIHLPAEELIQSIQFVCKSWRETITGPYCWTQIDIESWCRRRNNQILIERGVIDLVRRSDGTCTSFSAFKLTNAAFSFVPHSLKRLKVLKIPMSDLTDKMLIKHVASLKLLTFVDISYCVKITCKGIEALGKSCTSLVRLRRNIPPPEWQQDIGALSSKKDDSEALVVANTMPGLCHLELAYGCFTDLGLDAILAKCRNLTRLDIIGCYGVKLEGDLEDRCGRLPMFRPPWDDDFF